MHFNAVSFYKSIVNRVLRIHSIMKMVILLELVNIPTCLSFYTLIKRFLSLITSKPSMNHG